MSAANDYSRLGVVHQDTTHDYTAVMAFCRDPRNWFLRARGEWDEENHCPLPRRDGDYSETSNPDRS